MLIGYTMLRVTKKILRLDLVKIDVQDIRLGILVIQQHCSADVLCLFFCKDSADFRLNVVFPEVTFVYFELISKHMTDG